MEDSFFDYEITYDYGYDDDFNYDPPSPFDFVYEPDTKEEPITTTEKPIVSAHIPYPRNIHQGPGHPRRRTIPTPDIWSKYDTFVSQNYTPTDLDTLKILCNMKDKKFNSGYVLMPVTHVQSFRNDNHRIVRHAIYIKDPKIFSQMRIPAPSRDFERYEAKRD